MYNIISVYPRGFIFQFTPGQISVYHEFIFQYTLGQISVYPEFIFQYTLHVNRISMYPPRESDFNIGEFRFQYTLGAVFPLSPPAGGTGGISPWIGRFW